MNRDGLTEENLQSGETIRVSQREREERVLSKQAEDVSFSRSERDADQRSESGKRRQKPKNQPEMKQGEALSDSGGLRAEVSAGADFDGLSGNLMAADRRESLEMESDGEQETAPSGHSGIREQSFRSGNIRGHPSGTSAFLESAAETSHLRKKKLVQEYARKERGKPEDTAAMEDFREEIKEKTKREQLRKEQKKAGRLSFGDEESGMVRGAGMGISKKGSFNGGRLRRCLRSWESPRSRAGKRCRGGDTPGGADGRKCPPVRHAPDKPWTAQEKCPPAGSRFHGNGEKPAFV